MDGVNGWIVFSQLNWDVREEHRAAGAISSCQQSSQVTIHWPNVFHVFPVWALTIFFRLVAGLLTFTQTHKSKVTARLFELDEFRCSFWVFNLSYTPAGDGNPATEHHFSPNVHHTQLILVQYSYTHNAGKEQENLLQGRAEPSSAPLPELPGESAPLLQGGRPL